MTSAKVRKTASKSRISLFIRFRLRIFLRIRPTVPVSYPIVSTSLCTPSKTLRWSSSSTNILSWAWSSYSAPASKFRAMSRFSFISLSCWTSPFPPIFCCVIYTSVLPLKSNCLSNSTLSFRNRLSLASSSS